MIPFGEYLPDQPDLDNPGLTVALNATPYLQGYGPVKALAPFATALDARCRGAIGAKDDSGVVYNYAGTATKLYVLADAAWTDVTNTGGDYTTDVGERWEFVAWKQKVLAVNWDANHNDNPQSITLGGANFADLTSAFQARHIAVIGDYVVMGNTFDASDGDQPLRVRNSAIGDETDWTVSAVTLANFTDLRNGGQIQRIVSGAVGLIVCESSVYRMTPLGGGAVPFDFDEIDPGVGTHAPGGVISAGRHVFMLADDGFRVSIDRGPTQRIGSEKVNRAVLSELNTEALDRVTGAFDPRSGLVYWALPIPGAVDGTPNRLYVFNPEANRWSVIDTAVELIYASGAAGYTLEGLDSISTSLDALPESLDSPVWAGGNLELAAFDASHRLGYFSGAPMTATLETQELQLGRGRTSLRGVRPEIDGGTVTLAVGTRDRQQDAVVYTMAQPVRASGRVSLRRAARYHRFRLTLSGEWTRAVGLGEVELSPAGSR